MIKCCEPIIESRFFSRVLSVSKTENRFFSRSFGFQKEKETDKPTRFFRSPLLFPVPHGNNAYLVHICMGTPMCADARVAPRLTENRVPGGGYPEPSEPEPSRSNSRNRGYLYPRYPSFVLYKAPKTGVYVDLYIHCMHQLCPKTFASRPCRLQAKNGEYPHLRPHSTLRTHNTPA